MKSDEEIVQEWKSLEDSNLNRICQLLDEYEIDVQTYLIDLVASLCHTSRLVMMTNTSDASAVYSRWLYWKACKYMTCEPLERIACTSSKFGRTYHPSTVCNGINKMNGLVETKGIWKSRWQIVKRIINLHDYDNKGN